jgi:hypothetical protein
MENEKTKALIFLEWLTGLKYSLGYWRDQTAIKTK